ncbi:MAG TPA: glycosyltransferase family 87 protein, partial [Bryobacteraceae bacterium]|nr:glycosyltransferase family 87 protein [Bryobacteraceae bacterium]
MTQPQRRWLLWIAALAAVAISLIPSLHWGWTHVATDFPNYHTAAVLARKHAPLRYFYEWTWFQRQMNYAGWGRQLGGYNPQPPLTMVPFLPLTPLSPLHAKQTWLAMNLVFLAGTIWMLARLTRLPAAALLLLAMAGHNTLAGNFELGQWYVLLLFTLTLGVYLLLTGHDFSAGAVFGIICAMKGYGAPFLLYLAWKRRWRAFNGMALAAGALAIVGIAWFGWADNLYYLTGVFARGMAGDSNNPYAPQLPTISSFLRYTLIPEPELNPHPLANLPGLAFFLQQLVTLGAIVFCLIAFP